MIGEHDCAILFQKDETFEVFREVGAKLMILRTLGKSVFFGFKDWFFAEENVRQLPLAFFTCSRRDAPSI